MNKNEDFLSRRICLRIKGLAHEQGISGLDLSKKSGVSYHTVNDVMAGRAQLRPSTVGKLAQALKVNYVDITGIEADSQQKNEPDGYPPGITMLVAFRYIADQIGVSVESVKNAIAELMRS